MDTFVHAGKHTPSQCAHLCSQLRLLCSDSRDQPKVHKLMCNYIIREMWFWRLCAFYRSPARAVSDAKSTAKSATTTIYLYKYIYIHIHIWYFTLNSSECVVSISFHLHRDRYCLIDVGDSVERFRQPEASSSLWCCLSVFCIQKELPLSCCVFLSSFYFMLFFARTTCTVHPHAFESYR